MLPSTHQQTTKNPPNNLTYSLIWSRNKFNKPKKWSDFSNLFRRAPCTINKNILFSAKAPPRRRPTHYIRWSASIHLCAEKLKPLGNGGAPQLTCGRPQRTTWPIAAGHVLASCSQSLALCRPLPLLLLLLLQIGRPKAPTLALYKTPATREWAPIMVSPETMASMLILSMWLVHKQTFLANFIFAHLLYLLLH